MRTREVTQLCIGIVALLGCARGGAVSHADAEPPCMPFEARACPCVGGGTGMQTCSRSGRAFGACHGCNADLADGGAWLATQDDGSAFDPLSPQAGSVCGVGLPVLCEPQRQKCCARSLSVDTCVADDEPCTCNFESCEVVEVHCDGPEDCAQGEVCCGTLEYEDGGGAHYTAFSCAAQCGKQQNLACHEHGQLCPSGLLCTDSQLIPNVQICVDPVSADQ